MNALASLSYLEIEVMRSPVYYEHISLNIP